VTPTTQRLVNELKWGNGPAFDAAAAELVDENPQGMDKLADAVCSPAEQDPQHADDATSRLQSAVRLLIQAQAELDSVSVKYPLCVEVNLAKCEMNAARRKLVLVSRELGARAGRNTTLALHAGMGEGPAVEQRRSDEEG
jgi:hypothetical protein